MSTRAAPNGLGIDGDGSADLASTTTFDAREGPATEEGEVRVALAKRKSFSGGRTWSKRPVAGSSVVLTGDFDGDGRADIVTFAGLESGAVFVALSDFALGAPRTTDEEGTGER